MGSGTLRITFHCRPLSGFVFIFQLTALKQNHLGWFVLLCCWGVPDGTFLKHSFHSFRILWIGKFVHHHRLQGGEPWGQDSSGWRSWAGAFSAAPSLRYRDFVTCICCPSRGLDFMLLASVKWLFQLYFWKKKFCILHAALFQSLKCSNSCIMLFFFFFQVHCVFQVDARPWFSHFTILTSTCVPT